MKEDEISERFKISRNDDENEAVYLSEADDLRIEKLSHRMTIISIIIPCLVIIILFLTYLDIKRRVTTTRDTGAIGVQNLSKDLESRFSVLSLKQAKLEESLSIQDAALKKSSAALQVRFKKLESSFKSGLSKKADKKSISALKSTIGKSVEPVRKTMMDLSGRLDKLNEELTAHLSLMKEQVDNQKTEVENLKSLVESLNKERITKEDVKIAIEIEKLSLRKILDDQLSEVNAKMETVQKETRDQLKTLKAIQTELKKMGATKPVAATPKPKPAATAKPAADSVPPDVPESNKIQEQSID